MKYGEADKGLFLIRLALAAVFIAHGVAKLMAVDATMGFFETLGLPGAVGVLVGIVELLAGLAMLIGQYTRHAGYALAIIMVGAIGLVKKDMGFLGGWEFDVVLLLASLGVAMTGPGEMKIDMKK